MTQNQIKGVNMSIQTLSDNAIMRFYDICNIPHGSGNEKEIGQWLIQWAKNHQYDYQQDEVGNVIIQVPGKGTVKNQSPIVLQGHMDMVCVKDAASDHDFLKDPIQTYIENGWMKAKHTTLGADNGIAIAMAMAIAEDQSLDHPPLELLFTVDEERGLTGANFLKPGTLKGKILLNLDSEEEGEFTIGCAGGKDTHIELPLHFVNCKECRHIEINISGLTGGHSGMEINQNRANAIQLMARLLNHLFAVEAFRLVDIKAGLAHNAIPRDACAKISVKPESFDLMMKQFTDFANVLIKEFQETEKNMSISFDEPVCACSENNNQCDCTVIDEQDTCKIIQLLMALPHGVAFLSPSNPELVETSNNLAIVKIENQKLLILNSQRSSSASRNDYITQKIESVARLAGAKVESGNGYPSWQPNWNSPLLKKCEEVYERLNQVKPKINVIHAGLECGIIGAKHEGMDMISMGPNIRTPHSPEERMEMISVEKTMHFLTELLKSF